MMRIISCTIHLLMFTGLVRSRQEAMQFILQNNNKNSFILKSEIYVGCMH